MNGFLEQINKLSPKRLALLALELQSKLEAAERRQSEPIAIIGMACRFPGADSPEAYWDLLRNGVDAITEIPPSRWDRDAYYDPDADAPGKIATRWGGFVEPIDTFEPQLFGISPREAQSMDPQQRMLLEVSWEALERAGLSPHRLSGSPTGVFVGICNGDYGNLLMGGDPEQIDAYLSTGNAHSVASGRLSYVLGLQGPSITIDTACSSSLVATHMAIQSLRNGECRMALAGGSNAILSPVTTITLSRSRMMAADGRCKAFDARADGFVRSEGCGVVVLKRLSHALADGDPILAVIRGSAINQDGRSNGLTAPNGPSQAAVIRAALADAGLSPADVQYVETHGTGTSLGDPIEVQALGAALSAGRSNENRLQIGSVKTNLGHLESAAGVAGLIKLALMLQHGEIPPLLHLTALNPEVAWDELPIDAPTTLTPWPGKEGQRIGAVSSFGFSGTNAHLILESPPAPPKGEAAERAADLLTLSARTPSALRALAGRYERFLGEHPDLDPADAAYTANCGRALLPHRLAVAGRSLAELRDALAAFLAGEETEQWVSRHAEGPRAPAVAFLFSGHGALYAGMGRRLYDTEPVFRQALDRCDALLREHIDRTLPEILFADETEAAPGGRRLIDRMEYAQPALFALQYALVELWRAWGIEPAAVAGHSAGEYAAAVAAGVLSLEDGLRLVAARGRLMASLPPDGEMAAVFADEARVAQALAPYAESVSIAAINGPESIVISGRAEAVHALLADFEAMGIKTRPLEIPVAAHSPQVEAILGPFAQVVAQVRYAPPQLEYVSGKTGRAAGSRDLSDPGYWTTHLRQPVRFADAARTLYEQGYRVFVEIGPQPTLLGMARRFLPQEGTVWAPSLRQQHDDALQMLVSLGSLFAAGVAVAWDGFYGEERRRRVLLPTYPFERERYWIDAAAWSPRREGRARPGAHPLLGHPLHSPALQGTVFEAHLGVTQPPFLAHHRIHGVALMPSPVYLEMAQAAARETLGAKPWAIEQFTIDEALILPEQGERGVQLVLTQDEAGQASFQVFSQADDGARWTLHAKGRLAPAAERVDGGPLPLAEIQARCSERIDAASYYDRLAAMGLEFGDSFRGLSQIWRRDGEALGLVELPSNLEAEASRYSVHPALLDACFHLLGAPLPQAGAQQTYLLVGIDRLEIHAAPGTRLWNHTQLQPGSQNDGLLVGDISLYDEAGSLIAEATGLRLLMASRETLLQAIRRPANDWLYEVSWQPASDVAEDSPPQAARRQNPHAVAEEAGSLFPALAGQHQLDHFAALLPDLERLATTYALHALRELGWSPAPGTPVDSARLADQLGIAPQHHRLFERLLAIAAEEGLLRQAGSGWEAAGPLTAASEPAALAAVLQERAAGGAAGDAAAVALTVRCGERLAGVLRGQVDPLQLLFPGGSLEQTESLYRDSASAKVHNSLIRSIVEKAAAGLPADRPLRLLEIGAGSGATTGYLLPALSSRSVEYWFTDVSPLFTARAASAFQAHPFVRYAIFDAEREPGAQGIPAGSFDIVIAANVLHATANLRQTLANVRRTLAPGGLLILLEGTRPQRWVDITFGLTEGWWRFSDGDLRTRHPLLGARQWTALLETSGFAETAVLADAAGETDQIILLASAAAEETPAAADQWLVFADSGGAGERLAQALARAGARCDLVTAGAEFARLGEGRWQAPPADADAFRRLLAALDQTAGVRRVLYLWGLDALTGEESTAEVMLHSQELVSSGVFALVKALAGQNARLWLATRNAQPAGAQETPLAVAQAPLWGLGRVLALEHPELWGGLIDLPAAAEPGAETEWLLALPAGRAGEDQIALREGKAYVPRLVRAPLRQAGAYPFKDDASYLITGGLGGLGLKLARWMAANGARHLVLTGRHGLPERSAWAGLAAGSREAGQVEVVRALEAQGVNVHGPAIDVAERAQMEALFARFGADLPPLRGVVHAAADLSSGPMRDLPLDALRAQMRPKLGGAWLLHELTRTHALDFFVLFSSTTALWGSHDLAHYAAANQALDALAHYRRTLGLPALSVNWGTWSEMRVASAAEQRRVAGYGLLQMPADQALDVLGALLVEGRRAQAAVAAVDWQTLKPVYEARGERPLFALIPAQAQRAAPAQAGRDSTPSLLRRLEGAASSERAALVAAFVRDAVAHALGITHKDQLDERQGLFEMGMDSLMSVELKGKLEAAVGQTLPSTLTFNYPSIEALSGFLANEVLGQAKEAAAENPPPAAKGAESHAADADIDDLSEDDLAALIEAKLARLR